MQVISYAMHAVRRQLRGSDRVYGALSRFGSSRGAYLPNQSTKLCLEGYPSSGNTFAMRLAQKLLAETEIASHTHAYGSVARARRMDIPTVLVLRQPQDTISSYCVRFDKAVPWAMREYIDFHDRVLSHPEGLVRLDFEILIKEPQKAVLGLAHFLGLSMDASRAVVLAQEAKEELEAVRKKQVETVGVHAIGWPTKEKEAKKARVRDAITNSSRWARCQELHRRVQSSVTDLMEA